MGERPPGPGSPSEEAVEALRRRDRILEAVSYAARTFLRAADWRSQVEDVLARLGAATGVSRIYVFENRVDGAGLLRTSQRYEWTARDIAPQIDNHDLQDVTYEESGFGRWAEELADGRTVGGVVSDFPPDEQELLRAQGIRSLLVVPVQTDDELWGFMGFDDCVEPREWTGPEVDVLRAAADTLAAADQRRRTEEALRESEAQLRHAQRMEAVGRLAAGVAHDFNNLLTAIRANADFLILDLPDDHPSLEEVEEIREAAIRAADLTSQLLAFGRKQVLRPQALDLNEVVRDTELLLGRVLQANIQLGTDLEPDLPPVYADRSQVEQVLVNLAVNARDAMEQDGGGRLLVRTCGVRLDAETARERGCPDEGLFVVLSVSDTGHGMSQRIRERAFEPFFTTKPAGKGTGLGLSSVYGTARQSGGGAWIESEPGRGTKVSIALPPAEYGAEIDPETAADDGLLA